MSSEHLDFGESIECSITQFFGIITLNRTLRSNAFTIDMLRNLKNVITYCQNSESIRGLILTANGTSFSTGMDLDYIDGSDHEAVKELESTAADICNLLYNGKPAICAINGRTMGEGVVFLVCCDYKIAVKESFFQMPEIYSGIFPGTGCSVFFPKILGITWTKKMLMLAEKVNAEKALEIGLIDELVNSRDELMKLALEKAKFLSAKNQAVLNAIKLCCNYFFDRPYDVAYPLEKEACFWYEHEDKNEFITNFRKKFE